MAEGDTRRIFERLDQMGQELTRLVVLGEAKNRQCDQQEKNCRSRGAYNKLRMSKRLHPRKRKFTGLVGDISGSCLWCGYKVSDKNV